MVDVPGGRPRTCGTVMGINLMRSGWRLNCCNWNCVSVGRKKKMVWPLSASLLEMWRNEVRWPMANHGYITILNLFSTILCLINDFGEMFNRLKETTNNHINKIINVRDYYGHHLACVMLLIF